MATTTNWRPYLDAISLMSSGRAMAALFTVILSAPASSRREASSRLLMPPPTVKGMLTASATRLTSAAKVFRPSRVALMSR